MKKLVSIVFVFVLLLAAVPSAMAGGPETIYEEEYQFELEIANCGDWSVVDLVTGEAIEKMYFAA